MTVPDIVRVDARRKPTPRILHVVVVAAAAVLATACSTDAASEAASDGGANPTGDATVLVGAAAFAPADLVVEKDTTVTWTREGGVAHDVTGDGFSSQVQSEGDFQHTFDEVGVRSYRCNLHAGMEGAVTVVRP